MSKKLTASIPISLIFILLVWLGLRDVITIVSRILPSITSEFLCLSFSVTGVFIGLTILANKSLKIYGLVMFISLIGLVLLNLQVADHIIPRRLVQPYPQEIAQIYVEAIIEDNMDKAYSLTDGTQDCKEQISKSILQVQEKLTESYDDGWRQLEIGEIEFSIISLTEPFPQETFTVHVSDAEGEPYFFTALNTTYRRFGRRYTCGQ